MKHPALRSAFAAIILAAAAACAAIAPAPAKVDQGILVGANGMTLYTFDKDPAGGAKSVCNGPCAANWPPLMAEPGAHPVGDYTILTRDDGSRQWAYKGKPLYFWVKDRRPGEQTGDGVNKVWHTARQ